MRSTYNVKLKQGMITKIVYVTVPSPIRLMNFRLDKFSIRKIGRIRMFRIIT